MAKVNVKGPIISSDEKWIYDWFGIEAVCATDIEKAIKDANGEELEVIINSPGGYVDVGSEIYTLLKDYKGKTTGKIVGMAASAASVASMGVDILKISPTARIMIHNASGIIQGDYRAMDHGSEMLKECNKAISNAYMLKTGMKQEELLDLMNKETFMNAQRAKELGFVDEIMFDTTNKLTNSCENTGMLPKDVIEKIRNSIDNPNKINNKSNTNELENEKLNNLKNRLAFKNKNVASFLFCQKQGGMNNE
ncbi:head maturation protease, ClpP-related [Clostridium brassicae]|uniref:ATP-dependent Clp protease proteolytic subunit n=1 Tax=Clostridium brassicae TaxID=2999072 RepID=A0ABT4D6Z7_9CLOT|nr:head maturation protease, ClpP-related [Clostridium brassicae]MCY6957953.1 Clp protease ClpP [Clostridium brassicae]